MVWLEERELLRRLRRGDPSALEELMDRDMGFACGLAGSVLRGRPRDAEEVVSDAFLALWEHAGQVEPGKLRPWLGRVVRNKALQTAADIGAALAMPPSTVKVRLHRGRKKLKELLMERGYSCACADD